MYSLSPTEYLDSLLIDYTLIPHNPAFTAQETAEKAHIKGENLSKVIVVGNDHYRSMVVIPADNMLVQTELSRLLMQPDLSILPESEFREYYPECEVGAMPPFGRLYDMSVFVAKELVNQEYIIFNGGTHQLLIKMHTHDFLDITNARVISVGYKKAANLPYTVKSEQPGWFWV